MEAYSVRINRRDGALEISGPDKDWIAEQIAALRVVYESAPAVLPQTETPDAGASNAGSDAGPGKPKPKSRRRTTTRSSSGGSEAALTDKFTRDVAERFQAFCDARHEDHKKAQPDVAALIATFALDDLGEDSISPDDLIVVHRAMGWAPPKNPSGVLGNAIARKGYFSGMKDGKTQLTPTGEHFGRHASKEAAAK
jgi:hypothetical protein